MKKLFIILISFSSLSLFSQNIEIIGGLNKNSFYDFNKNEGHFTSTYSSGFGYSARIAIENIKADWLTLRFTLSYEKYSGEIEASDGGLGGGFTTVAEIDKSIISLGIFPLNFKIKNKIDLNFGMEISRLINENFEGTNSGWIMEQPDWSYDLNNKYERFNSLTYFGLRGRVAYDFNLSNTFVISPQYSYYLGLSNEFDEFPKATKSMRHYFCIGIEKKLK